MANRHIPYQLCRGYKLPMRFSSERFLEAINYKPLPGDLFLVSYPKTGSTWIQYIVYLIMNGGKSPNDVASLIATTPYVQRDGFPPISAESTKPIALKYQMPFRFVPHSKDCKYIHVARNPMDTCVSFYHFCKTLPGYDFENGTWDEFFELFLEGDLPFGDYFENLTSWYERLNEPNFCFVTYEEMKVDLHGIIKKVALFLGKTLSEDLVHKIAHYSSLQYMKENVNSHLERYLSAAPGTWKLGFYSEESSTPKKKATLIRKGEVGQWRFFFSAEQQQRMKRAFYNETQFSNARNLWANIMKYEPD